ncbi:MAG: hypothetical protein IID46_13810 [Planctomycetes bacterium]|nr:hypothetical protein [Planctomycetota bacterium]
MIQPLIYMDFRGNPISLAYLDDEERKLIDRLKRRSHTHRDWNDFENYWTKRIAELYDKRGVPRKESCKTAVFKIAQDLGSRIGIEQGLVRVPDYRSELGALIREKFKNRREFCKATGISEDMLSHVLARRKHLAIDTLEEALKKIGCTLRIVPLPTESTKASK